MLRWAKKKLAELEQENLCGFIFKSKSPSSGIGGVKVYTPSGMLSRKGVGIFGRAFINHFPHLPVEDDGHIHNPGLREKLYRECICLQTMAGIQEERWVRS